MSANTQERLATGPPATVRAAPSFTAHPAM